MNQLEQTYSAFIAHGYGYYSRDITSHMMFMLNGITKARDELKPENTKFILTVKPNTRVTIIIERTIIRLLSEP